MPDAGRPRIHYSQCWEDAAVARRALRIPAGGRVLAIGAAGDNALALLADDPAQIFAVDMNPAQTALIALKLSALRLEPVVSAREFLGASPGSDRLATYERLRAAMPRAAADFWDGIPQAIEGGVIHVGRFERYLAAFRRWILPLAPGQAAVRAMLGAPDLEAQRLVYEQRWDTWRWRLLFRAMVNRPLLAAFGRHPGAFVHAPSVDVAGQFLDRARAGLTATSITRNPFVTYVLSGTYRPPYALPDYLTSALARQIALRAARLEILTASLLDVLSDMPARSIDAFYLSDVFELFSEPDYERALVEITRVGRPGARLCYWNNLVPRTRPARLAAKVESHAELAADLHRRDRAFLYSRLVVESVHGEATRAA